MTSSAADRILTKVQRQLWVLTACAGQDRSGLVATFVSRASIVKERPRILVSLAVGHYTTALVRRSGFFAAHLLSSRERELIWHFGLFSGRDADKLAGIDVHTGTTGAPILSGSSAWLDCRVENSLNAGDREIFLAEVVDAATTGDFDPLTIDALRAKATANQLARMDELFAQDSETDARLIDEFRARKR